MTKAQTPRYYRVSPDFWNDRAVEGWTDDGKLLALYLLTCPQRTTEGLFPFRTEYAQVDLRWDSERFDKGFAELLEAGFIKYDLDARVLLIVNALRYQAPENENQAKNAVKRLTSLPPTPLTCTFRMLCETLSEHLTKQLPDGFGEPTSTLNNSITQSPTSTSISGSATQSPSLRSTSEGSTSTSLTQPQSRVADDEEVLYTVPTRAAVRGSA